MKRSISLVNLIESCFQGLRSCCHDGFHRGEIGGFWKTKSELQIGSGAFDGVRGEQELVGEQVVMDHRTAGNTKRRKKNGAEDPSAVFARRTVFDDWKVAGSDALKDSPVLSRVHGGVLVRPIRVLGLGVYSSNPAFQVVGSRAGDEIRPDGNGKDFRCIS